MARFRKRFKARYGGFKKKYRARYKGSGSMRGFINTPFRIIKRPLGRHSGRNWMGISVAGWALVGVLLYLFVKPVKNWVNKLIHK